MVNARFLAVILLATSATLVANVAGAESKSKGKGKPQQVVPTGAEDSPQAPVADPVGERRLEEMTSRSGEGLVEVEHADGSKSIDLQGRFMSVMVAAPGADGSQTATCHTSHAALKQAQANNAITPAKGKPSQRLAPPAPIAPTTIAPRELQ
jgi:hypothetical protein